MLLQPKGAAHASEPPKEAAVQASQRQKEAAERPSPQAKEAAQAPSTNHNYNWIKNCSQITAKAQKGPKY